MREKFEHIEGSYLLSQNDGDKNVIWLQENGCHSISQCSQSKWIIGPKKHVGNNFGFFFYSRDIVVPPTKTNNWYLQSNNLETKELIISGT